MGCIAAWGGRWADLWGGAGYPYSWVAHPPHWALGDPGRPSDLSHPWGHGQRCDGTLRDWWTGGCCGGSVRGVAGVGGCADLGTYRHVCAVNVLSMLPGCLSYVLTHVGMLPVVVTTSHMKRMPRS